ncbi:hypothetical protein BJ742DRAFT_518918 [Cladochytrium replicatum]|nr:hypothetical protein BJ742DRAFT_518918 [Cladochytrium replicatum]
MSAILQQTIDTSGVPAKIFAEIDSLVNKLAESAAEDTSTGSCASHTAVEKVDSAKELPTSGAVPECPDNADAQIRVPDIVHSEKPPLQNTTSSSNDYVPGVTSSEFDSASVVVKSGTSVIYLTDSEMSSTDLISDQDVGTTGPDELIAEGRSDLAVVPDVGDSKGTEHDSLVATDSQVSLISKSEIKGNKILERLMVRDEGYEGDIEGASSAREDSSAVEDEPDTEPSLRQSGLRFRGRRRGHDEGEEADENDSDEYVEDGSGVMVTTEVLEVSFEDKEGDEGEIGMMEVMDGENDEDLEFEPVQEGDRKLNIIEEVWESIFTPGVNGRVQFFFNVFFFLLFGTLISTLAMVGETMHVSILLGVAIVLFVLLQWFFSELAMADAENQQPVEEEEEAPIIKDE